MFKFNMIPTNEYDRLLEFFKSNGMVYEKDLPLLIPNFVKAYKLTQGDDFLVGGMIIGFRQGKYVLDGIAVDKILRHMGLGKLLIKKAISYVKECGGSSLYLITKVPDFYLKQGFVFLNDFEEVHNLFNCEGCSKYLKDCPERLMKIDF